jgi:hypothetical protein
MPGNSVRKKRGPCRTAIPLQQEGADLIDDARTLTDKPLAHPVQCLQVELVGRLGGDELHGRALHRLGDCFRIAIVILLTFGIRRTYFAGISRAS